MRDRLIELLEKADQTVIGFSIEGDVEVLADELLAEGVIVPPCKVGQTVYCVRYDKARKPFIKPLGILSVTVWGKGKVTIFTTKEDTLGVTAFLSQEEAEKALAERSENGT